MNPKRSEKNSKSQAFSGPGLADCAKRLQSARPLCLQRGAWGVLDRRLNSFLSLTPLSLPGSSAQSALHLGASPPLVTFFSIPYGPHKFSKNLTFCGPQAPKTTPKSKKKRSANLFEKHLQNKTHF